MFDVNLLAAMQLIGELTPHWRERRAGRVVNVSSMTRFVAAPMAVSYAATKGGMDSMTACLRLELAPWDIKLSQVIPGFVDTPTFETSREAGKDVRNRTGISQGAVSVASAAVDSLIRHIDDSGVHDHIPQNGKDAEACPNLPPGGC